MGSKIAKHKKIVCAIEVAIHDYIFIDTNSSSMCPAADNTQRTHGPKHPKALITQERPDIVRGAIV